MCAPPPPSLSYFFVVTTPVKSPAHAAPRGTHLGYLLMGPYLCTLTTDAASELNVLGHDGDTLGVDGTEIRVFEEADEVCLSRFLEREDGR